MSKTTVAVVLWSCLTLYFCSAALLNQDETMVDGTSQDFAHIASLMLYSVIWAGGLGVLAVLKFLLGRK